MRCARILLSPALSVLLVIPSATQQAASSTQASQLLQRSLAALQGNASLTDVTLSGTARRIAGSDDETGTATLKAIPGDACRIDLGLPSGSRSEILNATTTPPTGSWSGANGLLHSMAAHNLLTGSAWFFPAFTVGRSLASGKYVVVYIGQETHNGQTVQHVSVSQRPPLKAPPLGPSLAHLTQVDFFLDSVTLLPVAISFNIHPDNDAGLDLPVEIIFSDYRVVNGAQIPFHVQKYLNNGLTLDLQFQNVTTNTGLSAATFQVQ